MCVYRAACATHPFYFTLEALNGWLSKEQNVTTLASKMADATQRLASMDFITLLEVELISLVGFVRIEAISSVHSSCLGWLYSGTRLPSQKGRVHRRSLTLRNDRLSKAENR